MFTITKKRLGGGEYSEVFLYRNTNNNDQLVVAKVFSLNNRKIQRRVKKGNLKFTEQLHGAFLDEAALTSKLNTPHLINVIECATTADGKPYFIMPYHPSTIAYELWGSFIPQELGLPIKPARAEMLLRQIYGALAKLHHQGIVHRDVKPQNIYLDDQGSTVLCDFSHAKYPAAISPPQKKIRYTTLLSPEQIKNPEAVDGRADIYSLGVMGHQILTGKKPRRSTSSARSN